MKTCSYCGAQYPDDTAECPVDHAAMSAPPAAAATESQGAAFEFSTLTPEQMQQDLVTLVSCETLTSADMVVCRLEAAGITAFIPDKFRSQTLAFNLNSIGYVRVQVAPKDYDAAKEILSESGLGA
jgi:hypothetical protein